MQSLAEAKQALVDEFNKWISSGGTSTLVAKPVVSCRTTSISVAQITCTAACTSSRVTLALHITFLE